MIPQSNQHQISQQTIPVFIYFITPITPQKLLKLQTFYHEKLFIQVCLMNYSRLKLKIAPQKLSMLFFFIN